MKEKQIFKAIVGSQAYGTSTPASDTDYKGIYMEDLEQYIGFGYREQITVNKDEMYFELRRFVRLAMTANPTVLELLFSPKDCVISTSPQYELLYANRQKFITKQCANSFSGYAIQQIKKARDLDKKMKWEKSRVERKDLLDFCYVYNPIVGSTRPLKVFLHNRNMTQEDCGLIKLDHIRGCYALYSMQDDKSLKYHGIIGENSNEVRLSSIPLAEVPLCLMFFNKDGYSVHCKDYREYQEWLENRNTARYVESQNHGQKIDGKNLMHCKRLIEMAQEIATEGTISIRRPNAAELLKIRNGEVSLDNLLDECDDQVRALDNLFAKSNLPFNVDEQWAHQLILEVHGINK